MTIFEIGDQIWTTKDGQKINVLAKKGVVLTTGGFENNKEMIQTYFKFLKTYINQLRQQTLSFYQCILHSTKIRQKPKYFSLYKIA